MIIIDEQQIKNIKNIKTRPQKKWIFNCLLACIKKLNKTKDPKAWNKVNAIISGYYLQHYHNYYSNIYLDMDLEKRRKYIKRGYTSKHSKYSSEYQKKARQIYKLYRQGVIK